MTKQDLVNDLATAVKHYEFHRTAVAGMSLALLANRRSEDQITCLMTPYLEPFNTWTDRVNGIVGRLAGLENRRIRPMNYSFSANVHARCNTSCLEARGDVCTCSCGGANHGVHSGHVSEVQMAAVARRALALDAVDARMNAIVAAGEREADAAAYASDFDQDFAGAVA